MPKSVSIHDRFIRSILADKDLAIDYFKIGLPQFVLEKLDLSSLVQLPDSYVSEDLRKSISDIVYTCKLTGSEDHVKISLLIEHKSYVDRYTPIQIGSYIFAGLLKQIKGKEDLSLIIPLLLYHGKAGWKYRTLGHLFANVDASLRPFIPDYEYVYHNLGNIPDEQIVALENKFLSASILALKYSQLKSGLTRLIPTILTLALDGKTNLDSKLIVYTFESSGLDEEQVIAILDTLSFTVRQAVMSTLDIFVEKGRKEGKMEGLNQERERAVRNLLLKGSSVEFICEVMEVKPEYVARIQGLM